MVQSLCRGQHPTPTQAPEDLGQSLTALLWRAPAAVPRPSQSVQEGLAQVTALLADPRSGAVFGRISAQIGKMAVPHGVYNSAKGSAVLRDFRQI